MQIPQHAFFLGHHHLRGISKGIKQGLIKGPNLTAAVNRKVGMCSACEQAKSQRRAFSDGKKEEENLYVLRAH
jgi:hypothetical protein